MGLGWLPAIAARLPILGGVASSLIGAGDQIRSDQIRSDQIRSDQTEVAIGSPLIGASTQLPSYLISPYRISYPILSYPIPSYLIPTSSLIGAGTTLVALVAALFSYISSDLI